VQPFDKYPADSGSLESCSSSLSQLASGALANGRATTSAYAPAIANWSGLGAPELAAAPHPVQQAAQASNVALAWGSVVSQYWAGKVKQFNDAVEKITSDLDQAKGSDGHYGATGTNGKPPTSAQVSAARAKALRVAKSQWWKAYNSDITDGGQKAASMLKQGPTPSNVATAQHAGVLPSQGSSPLSYWAGGFTGQVLPPGSNPLTLTPWAVGRGMFLGNTTLGWLNKFKYGRVTGGVLRSTPNGGYMWVKPKWGAQAGSEGPYDALAKGSKILGYAGTGLSAANGAITQWQRDSSNPNLDTSAKVARSADRATLSAAGGWAGATAGAEGGAELGAMTSEFTGPIGPAVGGIVGGVVGGVVGSGVGNWVADKTVNLAGQAGDAISSGVSTGYNTVKDGVVNTVKDVTNPSNWVPHISFP
jgi:hypothetical protein